MSDGIINGAVDGNGAGSNEVGAEDVRALVARVEHPETVGCVELDGGDELVVVGSDAFLSDGTHVTPIGIELVDLGAERERDNDEALVIPIECDECTGRRHDRRFRETDLDDGRETDRAVRAARRIEPIAGKRIGRTARGEQKQREEASDRHRFDGQS